VNPANEDDENNLSAINSNPEREVTMKKILLLLIGLAVGTANAAPLGTAFSYSGRLKYQNQPANGSFDLQVKLFDALNGGNQIGPIVNVNGLAIANGLFVTSMDFGAGAFDGTALWLEISARPNGNGLFTLLSPRQPVNPSPYALYAPVAATANMTAVDSVSSASIQNSTITSNKIASGQVVKSLDGLTDDVTLAAGANVSLTRNGNTLTIASSAGASGWSLTGNAGTTGGPNFIGTTDSQPLEFKVKSLRALRLEFAGGLFRNSINTLGGGSINSLSGSPIGATISGGGLYDGLNFDLPNVVSADFGTIGGGAGNSVGGAYATIPGGLGNTANGFSSVALGQSARANHDGSFVWGDGNGDTDSTGARSFVVRASGGMTLNSPRGINLNAADRPIITRGWDPFDNSAGDKAGLGRWGLFMEFTEIVFGMPDADIGPRTLALGRYHRDGSYDALMTIRNTDGRASFNTDFAVVNGFGGEQAYIGGDGVGGDVQIGSMNPNIRNVAFYNGASGQYMDLFIRTLTLFGGADLAEPFQMSESEQEISKGAVVIIDDENPGHLKMSERAYDTRVAGVISGAGGVNPGIQLKQTGVLEGSQNVALTGRVYVQADATAVPIKPGDLLTSSDTPGHAMKVSDSARAQGAILGKAMTQLEKGRGLVLVLVTLQ
jgi:hypothetical protein